MTLRTAEPQPFLLVYDFDQDMNPVNVSQTHLEIVVDGPGYPYEVIWNATWTDPKTLSISYDVKPDLFGGNNEIATLRIVDEKVFVSNETDLNIDTETTSKR